MDDAGDRRKGDRRSQRDRRQGVRGGEDRRQGERRQGWAAAGLFTAVAALSVAPSAEAQIYTRRNAKGVVEATNVPVDRDFRLTYPGKGTLIHSAVWRLRPSYNGEFNHHIAAAASLHGVSVELVRAVIQVESDFDYLARSSKGAQGLMQLMPETARELGVSNAFDPRQNIFGGARYLKMLLNQFGDVALALAAYNAGPTAVARYKGVPPYKETRNYVAKIQSLLTGRAVAGAGARRAANVGLQSYVPSDTLRGGPTAAVAGTSARSRRAAVKPRDFYRWTDGAGVLHVSQEPPAEGVVYTTIRALD